MSTKPMGVVLVVAAMIGFVSLLTWRIALPQNNALVKHAMEELCLAGLSSYTECVKHTG